MNEAFPLTKEQKDNMCFKLIWLENSPVTTETFVLFHRCIFAENRRSVPIGYEYKVRVNSIVSVA